MIQHIDSTWMNYKITLLQCAFSYEYRIYCNYSIHQVLYFFWTGSNSVNVFLGLGLPWVLSTMYGVATGKPYKVPTGNLTQSVIIFSVLGALCIIILILRRKVRSDEMIWFDYLSQ